MNETPPPPHAHTRPQGTGTNNLPLGFTHQKESPKYRIEHGSWKSRKSKSMYRELLKVVSHGWSCSNTAKAKEWQHNTQGRTHTLHVRAVREPR